MRLFVIFFLSCYVAAQQLKQVHVVFRHGARNQLYDNWNWDKYKNVAGLLTGTGYRQHYVLGQWLRARYVDEMKLLSPELNQTEIYIRCTDSDRTLQSAFSNLYGLYPVGSGPILPVNVLEEFFLPPIEGIETIRIDVDATPSKFQPVPVHSLPMKYDGMLAFWSDEACPNNPKFQQQNVASEKYQNLVNQTVDIRHQFEIQMGLAADSVDLQALADYADTFVAARFNGYDLPANLTEASYQLLTQIYTLQNHLYYYGDKEFTNVLTSPFFENLIQEMDTVGPSSKSYKAVIYSAHDTTLLGLLDRLNLTSCECRLEVFYEKQVSNPACIYTQPGFAANLIFELYEGRNASDLYVQLLYNGTSVPICGSDRCQYDQFKAIIQDSQGDFAATCFVEQFETVVPSYMIVAISSLAILIIILFAVGVVFVSKLKKYNQQYNSLDQQSDKISLEPSY